MKKLIILMALMSIGCSKDNSPLPFEPNMVSRPMTVTCSINLSGFSTCDFRNTYALPQTECLRLVYTCEQGVVRMSEPICSGWLFRTEKNRTTLTVPFMGDVWDNCQLRIRRETPGGITIIN